MTTDLDTRLHTAAGSLHHAVEDLPLEAFPVPAQRVSGRFFGADPTFDERLEAADGLLRVAVDQPRERRRAVFLRPGLLECQALRAGAVAAADEAIDALTALPAAEGLNSVGVDIRQLTEWRA